MAAAVSVAQASRGMMGGAIAARAGLPPQFEHLLGPKRNLRSSSALNRDQGFSGVVSTFKRVLLSAAETVSLAAAGVKRSLETARLRGNNKPTYQATGGTLGSQRDLERGKQGQDPQRIHAQLYLVRALDPAKTREAAGRFGSWTGFAGAVNSMALINLPGTDPSNAPRPAPGTGNSPRVRSGQYDLASVMGMRVSASRSPNTGPDGTGRITVHGRGGGSFEIDEGFRLFVNDTPGKEAAHIGLSVFTCGNNPEENKARIAGAKAQISKVLGRQVDLIADPTIPNSPVLIRDANCVQASSINPEWSYSALKQAFDGKTYAGAQRAAFKTTRPKDHGLPPELQMMATMAAKEEIAIKPGQSLKDARELCRGVSPASAIMVIDGKTMRIRNRLTGDDLPISHEAFIGLPKGTYNVFYREQLDADPGLPARANDRHKAEKGGKVEAKVGPMLEIGQFEADGKGGFVQRKVSYTKAGADGMGEDTFARGAVTDHNLLVSIPGRQSPADGMGTKQYFHDGQEMTKGGLIEHRRQIALAARAKEAPAPVEQVPEPAPREKSPSRREDGPSPRAPRF